MEDKAQWVIEVAPSLGDRNKSIYINVDNLTPLILYLQYKR